MGPDFVTLLDGMFSFVLYDARSDTILAARDHVGITTLYQGFRHSDNSVWFASELKSLNEDCDKIIAFPPGEYYLAKMVPAKDSQERPHKIVSGTYTQHYKPEFYTHLETKLANPVPNTLSESELNQMYLRIRKGLERAVKKRLMAEVPYGVLLSGGLDSSLIAAIAQRQTRKIQSRLRENEQYSNVTGFGYGGESDMEMLSEDEDEQGSYFFNSILAIPRLLLFKFITSDIYFPPLISSNFQPLLYYLLAILISR